RRGAPRGWIRAVPSPGDEPDPGPCPGVPGRMALPDVTPDLPSPGWRATLALLRRLPQAGLSRSLGRLADVPLPRPIRPIVLARFARAVGADLSEVEQPLDAYPTLNAFFVRRLKPGLRSWPDDPLAVGSPVDGVVGAVG